MSDDRPERAPRPDSLLSKLPRTRPQRPSARRRPAGASAPAPAVDAGRPAPPRRRTPAPEPVPAPGRAELLDGALSAAGELAQASLSLGGRVLRGTLGRLKP